MDLRTLTEADVRELADSTKIFYRGEAYCESGAITQFSVSPHLIKAKVRGEYGLYTVQVRDDMDDLEATCNCPYDGLVCKHIVAVLLRYLQGDERSQATEAGKGPDALVQALTALSHQELLKLVLELAQEKPDVRRLLLATVPITPQILHQQPRQPKKVKTLKKTISDFFNELQHRSEYDDYYYDREYDESETYSELETTFEEAKTLNATDQIEVFWHAITCGDAMFEDYPIGTTQIEEAILLYAEAVRKLEASHANKQPYLNSLLSVLDWNMTSYGDTVRTVKQGLDIVCTEPADYHYLIQELEDYDQDYASDWMADYYLKLGDEDSYLRVRQANLNSEAQYLELANFWQAKGDATQYLATLEAGAHALLQQKSRDHGNEDEEDDYAPFYFYSYHRQSPLLSTLANYYRQQQDQANLCRILMITAEYNGVALELYQEIEGLATGLKLWQKHRSKLLKWAQSNPQELAKIHLHEQNWQAAIALAQARGPHYESLQVLVAEGIKEQEPEQAIQLYKELVQANIDRKQRKYYETAAGHARAMKAIYQSVLKDVTSWQRYLQDLRDRYRRYPALQSEFARL